MEAKVYHALQPNFGFKGFKAQPKWPDDYVHVATVKVPEYYANPLDWVYEQTNTIRHMWTENPSIQWCRSPQERSTSVGDIVIIDGTCNYCDHVGWIPVSDSPASPDAKD